MGQPGVEPIPGIDFHDPPVAAANPAARDGVVQARTDGPATEPVARPRAAPPQRGDSLSRAGNSRLVAHPTQRSRVRLRHAVAWHARHSRVPGMHEFAPR
jgi:hypothetical protein